MSRTLSSAQSQSAAEHMPVLSIYLYDTTSGWSAMHRCTYADLDRETVGSDPTDDVEPGIKRALKAFELLQGPGHGKDASERAVAPLSSCLAYLTSTRAYELVLAAYGQVSGHWALVLFRYSDRAPELRPAFLLRPSSSLTASELRSWMSDVVRGHTSRDEGEVGACTGDRGFGTPLLAAHLQ